MNINELSQLCQILNTLKPIVANQSLNRFTKEVSSNLSKKVSEIENKFLTEVSTLDLNNITNLDPVLNENFANNASYMSTIQEVLQDLKSRYTEYFKVAKHLTTLNEAYNNLFGENGELQDLAVILTDITSSTIRSHAKENIEAARKQFEIIYQERLTQLSTTKDKAKTEFDKDLVNKTPKEIFTPEFVKDLSKVASNVINNHKPVKEKKNKVVKEEKTELPVELKKLETLSNEVYTKDSDLAAMLAEEKKKVAAKKDKTK